MGANRQIFLGITIVLMLTQLIKHAKAEGSGNRQSGYVDNNIDNDIGNTLPVNVVLDINQCHECHNMNQRDLSIIENNGCQMMPENDPPECQEFYKRCLTKCHEQETAYMEALDSYFANMSSLKKNHFKAKLSTPFSENENDRTRGKKYIHDCATKKLGLNDTNLPFGWSKQSRCGGSSVVLSSMLSSNSSCTPVWNNLRDRVVFYTKCLERYDIYSYRRTSIAASRNLRNLAFELHRTQKQGANNRIGGGGAMVAGGILAGIGVLLAPVTGGGSLILQALGTAISLSGTLATFFGQNPEKTIKESIEELRYLKENGNSISTLLLLYIVSHEDLFDATNPTNPNASYTKLFRQYHRDVENNVKLNLLRNGVTVLQSANLAQLSVKALKSKAFLESAKSFGLRHNLHLGSASKFLQMKEGISNMYSKITGKVAKRGLPKLFANSKAVTFVKKYTPGMRLIGNGLSIGTGIWEMVQGHKELHRGMHHDVKLASHLVLSDTDDVIKAYLQTVGYNNNHNSSDVAVREEQMFVVNIHIDDGHWDYYSTMRLRFYSKDKDGGRTECTTEALQGVSRGWLRLDSRDKLGRCLHFNIVNQNLTATITSSYNIKDSVTINEIQISTDGKFLPTYSTKNVSIEANESLSPVIVLQPIVNRLVRIKTHTSTQTNSGTDNTLWARINYQGTNFNSSADVELNNYGNDRENNKVDVYEGGNVIGKLDILDDLLDSRPPGSLDENWNGSGEESVSISFKLGNEYAWGGWNVDLIKLYFLGEQSEELVFVCHTGEKWLPAGGNWTKFECELYRPEYPLQSIEKLSVNVCDKSDSGSTSDRIRLKFCKNRLDFTDTHRFEHSTEMGKCCTTNYFNGPFVTNNKAYIDGNTNVDDGGHKLGACEGFEALHDSLSMLVENTESDAVCFKSMEFYGKNDDAQSINSSTLGLPFKTCSLPTVWADSSQVRLDKQGDCTWRHYNNDSSKVICNMKNKINLSLLTLGLCTDYGSATSSSFTLTICDNQENCCETSTLNGDGQLFNSYGNYKKQIRGNDLGECLNKPMDNDMTIKVRMPGSDGICLNYFKFGDEAEEDFDNYHTECEYSAVHADSDQVMICPRWIQYDDAPIQCPGSEGPIKRIGLKVSSEEDAGSEGEIKIFIRSSNGDECVTNSLPAPNNPREYKEYNQIGHECKNLKVSDYVEVWVATVNQTDDLFLTHFYLDAADQDGNTKRMGCRFNQDEEFFAVAHGGRKSFGVPLKCM